MSARLDRYLTLSLFRPLNRSGFGQAKKQVPVLMYHSISEEAENAVHPYYRLATSPRRFAEQMQWLYDDGYAGVALEDALAASTRGNVENRKLAAITFDDGFRNFYTAAWPVMQQHGFTATMHLPTAYIGTQRKSFHGKECLTWNEVRELRAQGVRFGSHTVNHPKLYELNWDAIESELDLSKKTIDGELGEEITSFAYPYAFPQEDRQFTTCFTGLLRGHGYQNCATTVVGRQPADEKCFCVKRLPINSCDDQALFTAKLAGDYDWLTFVQRGVRSFKRLGLKNGSRCSP